MSGAAADLRTVTVRRTFDFPRDKVFAAWIDPSALSQWFGEEDTRILGVSLDPRVGGSYRFEATDGKRMGAVEGVYLVVDPPERLVFSWRWDRQERGYWADSQVTVEFNEVDAGTEIVITHEELPGDQGVAFHTRGWTQSLEKLGRMLA